MKLSVLMITYNHEAYIREAIDSVLAQRADFSFELVVGEDCSTDATRAVVRGYEAAHPGKVRGLYPEQNVGMCENLIRTYRACRGEYVALLEGDDYWIDPCKLQKQVDFLDQHLDYAMCYHNAHQRRGGPELMDMEPLCPADQKPILAFHDLLVLNCIPTCSVVYRRLAKAVFPDGLHRLRMCDRPLHLMHARHGRIGYLSEFMAVYRIHQGGAWSQLDFDRRVDGIIDMYAVMDKYFEGQYSAMIRFLRDYWEQQKGFVWLQGHASRLEEAVKNLTHQLGCKDTSIADLETEASRLSAERAHFQQQLKVLSTRRSVRLALQLARVKNLPRRAARVLRGLASPWNLS